MAASTIKMIELTGVPVCLLTCFHSLDPTMPLSRANAYNMRELLVMQNVPQKLLATKIIHLQSKTGDP